MTTARLSLLFVLMIIFANTSFAGQGSDKGEAEPECDYISGVDAL